MGSRALLTNHRAMRKSAISHRAITSMLIAASLVEEWIGFTWPLYETSMREPHLGPNSKGIRSVEEALAIPFFIDQAELASALKLRVLLKTRFLERV